MKRFLYSAFLLCFSTLCFNSCQKQKTTEPASQTGAWRIQRMIISPYEKAVDTFDFIYDGNNRLIKVEYKDSVRILATANLTYDGSLLKNITAERYDEHTGAYENALSSILTYDAMNKLSGIVIHSPNTPVDSFWLSYDSEGKISSVSDLFLVDTMPQLKFEESEFTFNAGNISLVKTIDSSVGVNGKATHEYSCLFDSQPNPFSKILPFFTVAQLSHLLIFDIYGQDLAGYFNQNNPTSTTINSIDPEFYSYSYQYNQEGYPAEISQFVSSAFSGTKNKLYDCTIVYEPVP